MIVEKLANEAIIIMCRRVKLVSIHHTINHINLKTIGSFWPNSQINMESLIPCLSAKAKYIISNHIPQISTKLPVPGK